MKIRREWTTHPKALPKGALPFGAVFTDHMFVMDYCDGEGWHDARIVPYGPVSLDPSAVVFHYAQEAFEGMKAYRTQEGNLQLFRPEMNARRFADSCERLCIPVIEEADFLRAVEALVQTDARWVPEGEGESLYLRPFVFATQASVGAHPSHTYSFMIIASPVGAYYAEGVNPIKIYVEDQFVRAVPGGTGFAKCGGNYGSSFLAQKKAAELGYTQVLWLDGVHRRYVEEVGSMNAFFKVRGTVFTAPLDGVVLPGVTRDSVLRLLRAWGIPVEERALAIDELQIASREGTLEEAWGTGTAAVISPIGELYYRGERMQIHNFQTGPLTEKLYRILTDIQWGRIEDPYGWVHPISEETGISQEEGL